MPCCHSRLEALLFPLCVDDFLVELSAVLPIFRRAAVTGEPEPLPDVPEDFDSGSRRCCWPDG
jgi:hypothetical protein